METCGFQRSSAAAAQSPRWRNPAARVPEADGLSQNALARAIDVPPRRVNEIVLGRRAVTADTDLRLARYFGMSEGFFLGLQTDYYPSAEVATRWVPAARIW